MCHTSSSFDPGNVSHLSLAIHELINKGSAPVLIITQSHHNNLSMRSIFFMAVLDLKSRCSDEQHRPS